MFKYGNRIVLVVSEVQLQMLKMQFPIVGIFYYVGRNI